MRKCEFVEYVDDEYGMACSEPELGVPTVMEITCREESRYVVVLKGMDVAGGNQRFRFTLRLCRDHARQVIEQETLIAQSGPTRNVAIKVIDTKSRFDMTVYPDRPNMPTRIVSRVQR